MEAPVAMLISFLQQYVLILHSRVDFSVDSDIISHSKVKEKLFTYFSEAFNVSPSFVQVYFTSLIPAVSHSKLTA